MSSLCYSIFRLDPYRGCSHNCQYCYTKMLPGYSVIPIPLDNYPLALAKALNKLDKTGIKLPPFRLSTLTDPFQPIERVKKISLGILNIAKKKNIHLIISTKSKLVAKSPWLDIIKELSDEKRVIVQITITLIDNDKSKILEPGAPVPEDRFKTVEKIASENIPIILRLQPIFPFLNDNPEFFEEYARNAKAAGAKQVIAEFYRFLSWKELIIFKKIMKEDHFKRVTKREMWEKYPLSSHKRPRIEIRLKTYKTLRETLDRNGLEFSTCREGFYFLHTAKNCCGMHFMKNYKLRPTLYESQNNIEIDSEKYLTIEEIEKIPLKKLKLKLKNHYKLLEKVARKPQIIGIPNLKKLGKII
ncbi:MAG: hypothetical protein J7K83_01495 [Candidatus Aenigmarchaeota archaeon]|nr:hypothetical protein [Candidatus Aenigmarchaeota archaeon]